MPNNNYFNKTWLNVCDWEVEYLLYSAFTSWIVGQTIHRHGSAVFIVTLAHETDQSMQNLYMMNTSHNERFLQGPVAVHCREVWLYPDTSLSEGVKKHFLRNRSPVVGKANFFEEKDISSIQNQTIEEKRIWKWIRMFSNECAWSNEGGRRRGQFNPNDK